ncbi:hypothetical protein MMC19_001061 [Ptychographa xylographoides]|nr:hypothetical protein [Ptychographa xylographoides]
MDSHKEAVATIAAKVRQFHHLKRPFRIYHGSTNSTRKSFRQRTQTIDLSSFSRVLEVDTQAKTALVEPNVPMDQLVQETLRYGLIPPVVMEFPGITVGGGFAGTAGESSSFKYGFFDRTVNWIEVILANGEISTASETTNSDLFHAAAGSLGTLCVITLLKLQLIDAKPYVELTYLPISNASQAISEISFATKNPSNDYIDGILFAPNKGVVIIGRSTSFVPPCTKAQYFHRRKDPWFYMHAQKKLEVSSPPTTEITPLVDFLFRYDRGGFWMGRTMFQYFLLPFTRRTRQLFDPLLRTRALYHMLHASGHAARMIIQDIAVPNTRAEELVDWVDKNLAIYPLWLCPLRQGYRPSLQPHMKPEPHAAAEAKSSPFQPEKDEEADGLMMNIGVWGPGPFSAERFVRINRDLERVVANLGGMKWLYAHTYYTVKEFWDVYDKGWYDTLRETYHAGTLPNVFDKVRCDVAAQEKALGGVWKVWPLSGLKGVLKTLLGRQYLVGK